MHAGNNIIISTITSLVRGEQIIQHPDPDNNNELNLLKES